MRTRYNTQFVINEFESLQEQLVDIWKLIGEADPTGPVQADNAVVVVPSMAIDMDLTSAALQAYEERMLFLLFLLRQPNIRMIYVTSRPIQPEVIDYYLDILPGVIITNARKRLFLVSPQDGSDRSLTEKLLDRPRLIEEIKSLIPDPAKTHLIPYTTTDIERELAVRLGIPMYAADPRFFAFGTKSGCRRVFAEESVHHPLGYEDISNEAELADAVATILAHKPEVQRVIVKHNEGREWHWERRCGSRGCRTSGESSRDQRTLEGDAF